MDIVEKLEAYLAHRKISAKQFSAESGISGSAISEFKKGKRGVSRDKALALAKALDVSVEWLMDDSTSWPPPPKTEEAGLSGAERELLQMARRVSRGDPELREAFDRLGLIGFRKDDTPPPPEPGDRRAEWQRMPPGAPGGAGVK